MIPKVEGYQLACIIGDGVRPERVGDVLLCLTVSLLPPHFSIYSIFFVSH